MCGLPAVLDLDGSRPDVRRYPVEAQDEGRLCRRDRVPVRRHGRHVIVVRVGQRAGCPGGSARSLRTAV